MKKDVLSRKTLLGEFRVLPPRLSISTGHWYNSGQYHKKKKELEGRLEGTFRGFLVQRRSPWTHSNSQCV